MKKTNLILLIIGIAAVLFNGSFITKQQVIKSTKKGERLYYVRYVIDGDTIVLGNGEKVRYIGIDTPEIKHPHKKVEWMGEEARAFNRKLVEHKWARLEFDIEIRDKYGRLLAYVFVDDIFINAELVKKGYARVYTFPPNVKYADLFIKFEREARQSGKGLWSK